MNSPGEKSRVLPDRVTWEEVRDTRPRGTEDIDWTYVHDGANSRVIVRRALDGVEGWLAEVVLTRTEGRLCVERVTMRPIDDVGTPLVTAEVFKRLRIAEFQRDIERHLASPAGQFLLPGDWLDTRLDRPRPGRAGRGEGFYALWAQRYVDALESTGGRPMALLKKRHNESEASIRAFLNKARALGLLTAAPKGKAGGELTDKARRLLRED